MRAATATVRVSMVTDEVSSLIREAETLLRESPAWLRWLATKAFEGLDEGIQLASLDGDEAGAAAASDLRILAKPAHEFVLFVAALRAGNGKPGIAVDFERELHGGAPHA